MDRLIIEASLADVSGIYLSKPDSSHFSPAVILEFKPSHAEQAGNAFAALKKIAGAAAIELAICRTLSAGVYDLEIKTGNLDEPVRICNKGIGRETLEALESQTLLNEELLLGSNILPAEDWLRVRAAHVKDCTLP
ncbi:hypothetical protein [Pedobacter sp. JY14-1]|uniref:hypothetical protein n=1 Tax=Pedobacter sp. JY14-1 TaxID=3034151 RepID=UPI0023E0B217|nr:hypothetical protein [Pedobacter sp. JY14-1]